MWKDKRQLKSLLRLVSRKTLLKGRWSSVCSSQMKKYCLWVMRIGNMLQRSCKSCDDKWQRGRGQIWNEKHGTFLFQGSRFTNDSLSFSHEYITLLTCDCFFNYFSYFRRYSVGCVGLVIGQLLVFVKVMAHFKPIGHNAGLCQINVVFIPLEHSTQNTWHSCWPELMAV